MPYAMLAELICRGFNSGLLTSKNLGTTGEMIGDEKVEEAADGDEIQTQNRSQLRLLSQ